MQLDGMIGGIASAAERAADLEASGYSGGWTAEIEHDPFLPLVAAASATSQLELGTSIAVAFARNPMNLAQLAWDLQAHSGGRFILGIGAGRIWMLARPRIGESEQLDRHELVAERRQLRIDRRPGRGLTSRKGQRLRFSRRHS